MRKRTQARELALQALYQLEIRGEEILPELDQFFLDQTEDKTIIEFARALIKGYQENQTEITRLIKDIVTNWDLSRLAAIDRTILKLAAYELIYRDDIPPAVSINEAVDLAKKYSSETSGAFVNGVLDKIVKNKKPQMNTDEPR